MSWNIVVIGLGPGGSAAAITAARSGMNVLGVEKRAEIGAPKRCAEGLSRTALERMQIKLPKNCISSEIDSVRIYAPNGRYLHLNFDQPEGWILERKVFDKYLASEAANAGANLYAKTEVTDIRYADDKIEVFVKGQINGWHEADVVIASDGVESTIARKLGLNTTNKLCDICSCAQFEMAGIDIDPKRIDFFFDQIRFPGGYAWIFPKGKSRANVGLGIRKPWAKKTAMEYLRDFVQSSEQLRDGSIIEVNAGGVPVGGFLKSMVLDRFMVVGDAAHQVNPIHGGGIAEAYVGGRIAAEVAIEAIKRNDCSKRFLKKYDKLWWNLRGKKLSSILKIREIIEKMDNDELNWLVDYVRAEDLIDLSRGSGFGKLARILLKKPRLAKYARKLI